MKSSSVFRRKTLLFSGIFLFLSIIFSYYFILYVPEKKRRVIENAGRVLEKTAENIQERVDVIIRLLNNSSAIKDASKKVTSTESNIEKIEDNKEKLSVLEDSLYNLEIKKIKDTVLLKKEIGILKTTVNKEKDDLIKLKSALNLYKKKYQEKIKNIISNELNSVINESVTHKLEFNSNDDIHKFSIPIAIIIKNFIREDVFDDFFIASINEKNRILYKTFNGQLFLNRSDSIEIYQPIKNLGPEENTKIHNADYILFSNTYEISLGSEKIEKWVLGGLKKRDTINSEIRSISPLFIIYILTGLLLLVLTMPLLKLRFMNPIELLSKRDVIAVGFSIYSIAALVTLIILSIYTYYFIEMDTGLFGGKVKNTLQILSKNVQNTFLEEVEKMSEELSEVDSLMPKYVDSKLFEDFKNKKKLIIKNNPTLKEDSIKIKNFAKKRTLSQVFDSISSDNDFFKIDSLKKENKFGQEYNNYKSIYWIDENGVEQLQVTTIQREKDFELIDNLSNREYVKAVKEEQLWTPFQNKEDSIFIQSIYSYGSGDNFCVLAKKSNFGSIENRILDDLGKLTPIEVVAVTFKPFSLFNTVLPTGYGFCIIDKEGEVQFHHDPDKNLQENFFEEIDGEPNLSEAISSKTQNYFKAQYHNIPHRVHVRPMGKMPFYIVTFFRTDYVRSPMAQIATQTLLFITLLISILLIVTIIYVRNEPNRKLRYKNLSYDWFYPESEHKEFKSWQLIKWACPKNIYASKPELIFIIIITLIFFLISIIFYSQNIIAYYCYIVIGAFVLSISVFFVGKILALKRIPIKYLHKIGYRISILLFLYFSSILPTYFFFHSAYRTEQATWMKHNLFKLALNIELQQINFERKISSKPLDSLNQNKLKNKFEEQLIGNIKLDTIKYQNIDTTNHSLLYNLKKTKKDSVGDTNYSTNPPFRFAYNKLVAQTQGFCNGYASDTSWFSKDIEKCIALTFNKSKEINLAGEGNALELSALTPNLKVGLIWPTWIILLFLSIPIYLIISFALRMIFPYFKEDKKSSIEKIKEFRKTNFFVVAFSESRRNIIEELNNNLGYRKDDIIDVMEVLSNEDIREYSKKLLSKPNIVLTHFGYQSWDYNINEKKLKLLESLQRTNARLIIISRLTPMQIKSVFEEKIEYYLNEDLEMAWKYESILMRWRDILASFALVFEHVGIDNNYKIEEQTDKKELYTIIENELRYAKLYERLKFRKNDLMKMKSKEDIILKIQRLAQPYYFALWNSCSKHEKFLLFDLAKDGFINTKNVQTIQRLIDRGLMKSNSKNGLVEIMNNSFRNFIVTNIKPSEALEMQRELSEKGTWRTTSMLILVVVIALVIFLGLIQQDILNDFLSAITAITATIPLLYRINSNIGLGSPVYSRPAEES